MSYVVHQNNIDTGTELISIHVFMTMHKISFHFKKKKRIQKFLCLHSLVAEHLANMARQT